MKNEILKYCIDQPHCNDEGAVAGSFRFPSEFLGFQGHFPGNPVVPAVVQIQIAQVCIAGVLGDLKHLDKVINAKFMDKVGADVTLMVTCINKGDGRFSCSVKAVETNTKVASFILEMS